jgi:hypothetical protein
MNTDAPGVPLRSPSAAERMRALRKRRRKGLRYVRIQVGATEIDGLIRKTYLEQKDRDDPDAIRLAIDAFISDAFFEAE